MALTRDNPTPAASSLTSGGTAVSVTTASSAASPTAAAPLDTATPPTGADLTGSTNIDAELVLAVPELGRPPVGTPIVEPTFGTVLTRLSAASDAGGFSTHVYSQLQAFSPNQQFVLLTESEVYVVRRMADGTPLQGLDTSPWNAPRWHPQLPATLVHFDSNEDTVLRVQFTDVEAGTTEDVFTFPSEYQRIFGNESFDELSEDGRWLAGMADRGEGDRVIFTVDLEAGALGAQLGLTDIYREQCAPDPEYGDVGPDWIAPSPLGRYLVVQWARAGTERCSGQETFDIASGAWIGRVIDHQQHGDLAVDVDGSEIFVTFDLTHPSGRLAVTRHALPGTETISPPTYLLVMDWMGSHISCRGTPGTCVVTTLDNDDGISSALEAEVFILNTDGQVQRLAHHRSTSCGYWVQPRASISRDNRYVIFASDWGGGCAGSELGQGDAYLIDLAASP